MASEKPNRLRSSELVLRVTKNKRKKPRGVDYFDVYNLGKPQHLFSSGKQQKTYIGLP